MLVEKDQAWGVLCLCAAWCGVCRQYQPDFQKLGDKYPQVHFAWVDVEAHEDLMGDVDVETFPTLLIGRGSHAVFLGPLLPQIKVLDRLLGSLLDGPVTKVPMSSEASLLWQRFVALSQR